MELDARLEQVILKGYSHGKNSNDAVSRNYFGTVKCFACGSMLEIATKDGVLLRASLLVPRLYLKVRQKEVRAAI